MKASITLVIASALALCGVFVVKAVGDTSLRGKISENKVVQVSVIAVLVIACAIHGSHFNMNLPHHSMGVPCIESLVNLRVITDTFQTCRTVVNVPVS